MGLAVSSFPGSNFLCVPCFSIPVFLVLVFRCSGIPVFRRSRVLAFRVSILPDQLCSNGVVSSSDIL